METKHQRRDFLKAAAATGAGFWVAAPSAQARNRSANQQINHAAIGAGGMGGGDVRGMAEAGANIVALCDVDEKRAAKSRASFPHAKFFRDFREMFDQMGQQIDSIIIGESGTLFSPNDYGSAYTLLPEEKFNDYKPPSPRLARIGGDTYGEFARAIQKGGPQGVMSNFGYAGPLTETVVLGCVAMRAKDRTILWDGPNMAITNDKDVNRYLRREYRQGWEV